MARRRPAPPAEPSGPHVRLRLAPSSRGGLGVFALDDVPGDTLVEACPVLEVSGTVRAELPDRCVVLSADDPERVGIPLGYGAMYNHAAQPNLTWEVDGTVMRLTTARPVPAGEELCIDYGAEWFDARGLEVL